MSVTPTLSAWNPSGYHLGRLLKFFNNVLSYCFRGQRPGQNPGRYRAAVAAQGGVGR
jgi:hypothetical protein